MKIDTISKFTGVSEEEIQQVKVELDSETAASSSLGNPAIAKD